MTARVPRRSTLLLVSAGLAAAGCRGAPPADHLSVFAAASLSEPFAALADSLKVRHPGLTVDYNFAGSQTLALQLTHGAGADVFASADQKWMQVAVDSNLVDGAPIIFANNRLVVIVPAKNPARILRLEDLARRGIKLVLAGEEVPVGHYAREALANLGRVPGFPPGFQARVLANVVSNEESVKGVVTKVQLGEADAGIVYSSDVMPKIRAEVTRIEIPDGQNVTAAYPIALLRRAEHPGLAREFVELVLSAAGQRVLTASGFPIRPI